MRKMFLLIAMIAMGVTLPAEARETRVKRLDESMITSNEIDITVTRLMHAAEVTGVGIAILNEGKVVYLKTYGERDKEKHLSLTKDSVMTSASFSKAAFAYMVTLKRLNHSLRLRNGQIQSELPAIPLHRTRKERAPVSGFVVPYNNHA